MEIRRSVTGAIVSPDAAWCWTGTKWAPLAGTPDTPKPGFIYTAKVMKSVTPSDIAAGVAWTRTVREHGSPQAASLHIGETEAAGRKQVVKQYPHAAAYEADVAPMSEKGWRVADQTQTGQRTSVLKTGAGALIGGVLTGGAGAVVGGALGHAWKGKSQLTIVWERD